MPQPAPVTLSLDACLPTMASGAKEKVLQFPLPRGCGRTADVPRHQPLHTAAAALKAGLLVDNRRQRPEALLLYVDGSYCEPQASWSVVCLSRHQGIWYWWGFFAGPVDERFAAGDAFTGELYGQLAALSLIAHEQVPSVLCYDCESAACVAQGRTATCAEDTLRRAVVSTTAFLAVRGCAPRFLHTKAQYR